MKLKGVADQKQNSEGFIACSLKKQWCWFGKIHKTIEVEANALNEPHFKGHEDMRWASEVRSSEFSEVMLTNKSLGHFNIRSAWGLRLYCWGGCYFGSRGGFEIPWNKNLLLGFRHVGECLKHAEKTRGVTKLCSKKNEGQNSRQTLTLGRSPWNKILHSHRAIDIIYIYIYINTFHIVCYLYTNSHLDYLKSDLIPSFQVEICASRV